MTITSDWLEIVRQREDIAKRIAIDTAHIERERLIYILLSYMSVTEAEHVAKVIVP